jgi:hypothetical protein
MFSLVAVWRDESKEPIKGRVKSYEFVGSFFVTVTESDAVLSIPHDILQTVELRELTEEEAKNYQESNTFREGEKSPWFAGMGATKT